MGKTKSKPSLTPRGWRLLEKALKSGVRSGIHRAWKYREDPEPAEPLIEAIDLEIISALAETFELEGD